MDVAAIIDYRHMWSEGFELVEGNCQGDFVIGRAAAIPTAKENVVTTGAILHGSGGVNISISAGVRLNDRVANIIMPAGQMVWVEIAGADISHFDLARANAAADPNHFVREVWMISGAGFVEEEDVIAHFVVTQRSGHDENAIAVRGRESEDNICISIRPLHGHDFARCDPLSAVRIIDRERDWKTEGLIGPIEPRLETDVIDVVKAREPKGDPLRGAWVGVGETAPDCAGDAIERS